MTVELEEALLKRIQAHGEAAYPDEGAGVLLGLPADDLRRVSEILPLVNEREAEARHNRYLITPQQLYQAELTAETMGFMVLGIFHSHPDHPAIPSDFDREWAMPWFSYIITSIIVGAADRSRSWRLSDDRDQFYEEQIRITSQTPRPPVLQFGESVDRQGGVEGEKHD
jgi:proteasome lid subunit RPN8/RPN11